MIVKLIIVQHGDARWVHDAWDEIAIEENNNGYEDALVAAEGAHGAANVRTVNVTVPNDLFDIAFAEPTVIGTVMG